MSLGLKVGVLTGRTATCVTLRLTELGVDLFLQGASDKAVGIETLCQQAGVELHESAYMGDDLIDLPALVRCGYPHGRGRRGQRGQERSPLRHACAGWARSSSRSPRAHPQGPGPVGRIARTVWDLNSECRSQVSLPFNRI